MQVEPGSTVTHRRPCVIEHVFVWWPGVPTHRRISGPELENLRRSLGASGGLPKDQVERLVVELDRLLAERRRMAMLVADLRGSWPELRRALNDLNAVLRDDV